MDAPSKQITTSNRHSSGWYTASEVALHCVPSDCWLTLLGLVYDVTSLLPLNPPYLAEPMLLRAGGDVSHWFEPRSKDVRLVQDPKLQILRAFTPQGRFIHIPPQGPISDWDNGYLLPWWLDDQYVIGRLSPKTRFVCIKNVLLANEVIIEVPSEETMKEILERYLPINSHARSYSWEAVVSDECGEFVRVDMDKSLAENGITDDSDLYSSMGMAADHVVPCIHVYYDDDLTIA
ncbi:hypothetical protein MPTK1_Vg00750 [Marchantia polymorpha subsp. ruderalis]|uniref:Cytochrome b5 domain-containing protein 1 n=1 Tax=Marchantia polymorpha TaxID=3197 RepID=A0A2R6VX52_MARPO|nr:hypothetical protein MARPO_YA0042 [Marchantia polymorpha]BBN20584.1 hypothetical protein Mp_Vg00750 [Marchantia polymorpha subsp. ruderalis]PTQ26177.1 hypothetical protein MARPO_YA0042 [Marchantia polymorpha]PTQ26178.1 hypothetical protein MARPO_YA0042 [Marchantia polymorpha]BBN20585.1 hypothetical protein Mp_Vg00750 [Marchantia polymorpha subsp. ruderalis]|eukprot:PTQ26176.1 hypothetical protein MARPO_YA0042 [Marchantia polymorpha]